MNALMNEHIHMPIEKFEELYDDFMIQVPITFKELKPSHLPIKPGVYAIFMNKDGLEKCLYVGRGINLQRMLYTNHLHGNLSTARLKKYLVDSQMVQDVDEAKKFIKDNCYFRFTMFPNSDHRFRGLFESYLTYKLETYFIQREH
jgi:hypothetical protein